MLYSEKVMDHFTHPRNLGKMDDADGVGEVGNAKCGDIMKIYIKVENDIITYVKKPEVPVHPSDPRKDSERG